MATPNMTGKKVNVLVYSGAPLSPLLPAQHQRYPSLCTQRIIRNGTTVESVRHTLYSLRRLLAPHYAVIPVTSDALLHEPWTATCALLVIPGGADLGYGRVLNGPGNRRIEQFVKRGGAYLGFCAGGYYGSQRCEFEVGDKTLQVIGERELAFYPGTCRGGAFAGFVYHSEAGARAAEISVNKDILNAGIVPERFRCYYNGGGVFVDAPTLADKGVEVLASFEEELNVDPGEGKAAGGLFLRDRIRSKALYPPWSNCLGDVCADGCRWPRIYKSAHGLPQGMSGQAGPAGDAEHDHRAVAVIAASTADLVASWQEIITKDGNEEIIKDENDTFRIERPGAWNLSQLEDSLPESSQSTEGIVDYNAIVKRLVVHDDVPSSKLTPYFNHHAFYSNLHQYQSQSREGASEFGAHLVYGEVVTSTNTILEKNPKLLRKLPNGFTASATTQVAGRGRGSNVWVSPAGALIFSTVLRHPLEKIQSAPVVFIQYLAAMAVVQGIKNYDAGYSELPVKLKWPNDVYALDPEHPEKKQYSKICGILVNSHYCANEYISVVGIGINATNASPTTSLTALAARFLGPRAAPITLEKLLARILTTFEELYTRFLRSGFDRSFEEMYYADWLHMHQVVTLEEEGGVRARIKGITRDYGLLLAEELGWNDRPTGRVWQLQSDSNSFDFFRGLVRRKV
ncbi:hypothetical protein ASPNIDRAFT_48905 [Aspergillus niger ATCC 1015]|uniref:BPL/LPL catalytic domain-containing protein n=1 Tax=Aspergillus niger (strain ATCC 1015 / CBS 113.46 / FGSC A1144 / LSHB Ac4 / NCTC 3858a / NRRL 328 / USDA 3528.7) TaxID=380704 RepID=G3Y6E9_ASPNA|nr:hypothetical protein ASPNIDRAFT_48905 [Aspergillus niger ATCC 1015]